MNAKTGEIICTKKGNKKREIASLTKMMTCYCAFKLIEQYGIDFKNVYIQVSRYACILGGTSANLKTNDVLTIWDLLHAMMLPSGNDAAFCLAENFGRYIYINSDKYKVKVKQNPGYASKKIKDPIKHFLFLMNKTANELGMKNTYYANPHGLNNTDSFSTASDQIKLSYHILKSKLIREIVNKTEYECEVEQMDQNIRVARWENTNKLLGKKGWQGIKTGVTTAAGPSLSAYYEDERNAYIIILLGSISKDIRWIESTRLIEWISRIQNS